MYKQILEFLTSQDDVEIKSGIDLVKILNNSQKISTLLLVLLHGTSDS